MCQAHSQVLFFKKNIFFEKKRKERKKRGGKGRKKKRAEEIEKRSPRKIKGIFRKLILAQKSNWPFQFFRFATIPQGKIFFILSCVDRWIGKQRSEWQRNCLKQSKVEIVSKLGKFCCPIQSLI